MNPGHQPQRFQTYKELEDASGFTLQNNDYIFLYDRYGGWFDQYGNYYNQNGQPEEAPLDDHSSSNDEDIEYSQGDSYEDQFQKQFGRPNDLSDEEQNGEQQILASIVANSQNLKEYPENRPLRVYFSNVCVKQSKEMVFNGYLQKISGVLNVILDKTETNKNKGTGIFIVSNKLNAQQLILLEGKKITSRQLYFTVEKYQNHILEPIKSQQLTFKPDTNTKKKFVLKNSSTSNSQQNQKTTNQSQWKFYKFQKDTFPKKSLFKQWMIQNGFNYQEDFKNLLKIQGQSKYVQIEMKVSTFKSVNGLTYQQKPVQFIPI